MKNHFLYILIIVLTCIACGSRGRIIYSFENNKGNYKFQATNPDTVINNEVNFWTTDISPVRDEPVQVNFIFGEPTANAEKLKAINVQVYDGSNNEKALPVTSELKIDYFDGQRIITNTWQNNTKQLNKLVDWKKANYTYTFMDKEYPMKNNIVHYNYSFRFQTEDYPDTLKLVVDFVWENGSRKYESRLIKGVYTPPGINVKF